MQIFTIFEVFGGFLGGLGIGACSWRVARGGLAR